MATPGGAAVSGASQRCTAAARMRACRHCTLCFMHADAPAILQAPAPPPGYPTGQGPLLPEGEPAEVSQRGLANTLQQGVNGAGKCGSVCGGSVRQRLRPQPAARATCRGITCSALFAAAAAAAAAAARSCALAAPRRPSPVLHPGPHAAVVRRMEHTAHAVAHPVDHARWKLSYWPKRMMHRAVDKCCCSIQ